ncbi:Ribosome biogenesis regulatory protein (RRS1) [Spironucleus salmonicida]|uniref:Ribosome biogenesis regulatory protein n=1 Tax=Spironucleus salmonicida TaxID=348837 RepID=V6LLT3_9EUKA|nr:Ribosome biogenesis regulatory protein (RRS1) [Spironucleus salmonicida]|eukprot:EST45647.1 Ribosome biogenesis regulatory protein (RRS1) [Spironucleus salmonicida]
MEYDLHYLSIYNPSIIKADVEELELMQLTSNALGLMFAELQKCKREFSQDGYLIELPMAKQILPREKSLPLPERTTKWDKFSKERGIRKLKKDRYVVDQATGEEHPRWGKDRISKNSISTPIIEGKKGVSDYAGCPDPFSKQKQDKRKRIAENSERRDKNDKFNKQHAKKHPLYEKKEEQEKKRGKKGK